MLNKSDLKVIRGGALLRSSLDEQFVDAYATDTRLMGVLVIYVKWQLSDQSAADKKSKILHQFFYVETTEEGIESYRGIYGNDEEELRFAEQSMMGGLGAGRVGLSMNEAVFLIQHYAELTRRFGNPLPDETEEYAFVLRRDGGVLGPEREENLLRRLCSDITSANQLVNYFLMRYFARDFAPVDMLASAHIDHGQLPGTFPATLCRNEISPPEEGAVQDEGSYVCESVIEEDSGHRIVVSEVGVRREQGRFVISSFVVLSMFSISVVEAAMKLSRPEFATVYEITGSVDQVLNELDNYYTGALQNLTEGGKLYVVFNENNRHLGKRVYLLNDDVKEILYVTVEDQLIVGCYTLSGIKRLENRIMLSRISGQLVEVAKYEFKEPVLYDYTMSYGGDFVRYVDEIMGFDNDDQ